MSGAPRPLTGDERRLLDALLANDFHGVAELREQGRAVAASPGCTCGCGSIDLHVPLDAPRSAAPSPVPVEGTVRDITGAVVAGLILFLEDGRLGYLEIYPLGGGDPPPTLPPPEQVTWGEAG